MMNLPPVAVRQADIDPSVMDRYMRIIRDSGAAPNHIIQKSGLYRRLLAGKKALALPPPLSHSYPWYEVIEAQGKVELTVEPSEWTFEKCRPYPLLINQGFWHVVSGNESDGYVVTVPGWDRLGFTWRVSMETVSAQHTSAVMVCHHDKTIPMITTAEQLQAEAEWHVDKRIAELKAVSSIADHADLLEFFMAAERVQFGTEDRLLNILATGHMDQAKRRLAQRRADGLPDAPDNIERQFSIASEVQMRLGETWKLVDGALMRESWWIQRLTPLDITPEHYLDV